jgi:NodT family efflux transporter outer membrane factor (OMF) lipoprotein
MVMLALVLLAPCGCTSLSEYVHNGFKVGPNYTPPPAPVANDWIDVGDKRKDKDDLSEWWQNFNDPILNDLICTAYRQNLTLEQAGLRILQARATVGIAVGELFPQTQLALASYNRIANSAETVNARLSNGGTRFFDQWNQGFALSWEIDFWGRYRRTVESARANLDASVADYDDVLVTLLSDVATNYVQLRTLEKRIAYAKMNVGIQQKTLTKAQARLKVDKNGALALEQSLTLLKQTEAGIPELEISLRQTSNRLCTLLGIPPEDLAAKLKAGEIPTPGPDAALGIPADLLRRRPDIRRAERQAATQAALIGVAESEFYPHLFLNGTLEYSAQTFKDMFRSSALAGNVGPSMQWNILHYGRILNGVRFQDAKFRESVASYQNSVLNAQEEVENGIVTFLKAHQRTKLQQASVDSAKKAEKIASTIWEVSGVDFTTVSLIQQNLVQQHDTLAQAEGEIALGFIQIYRALGGGWQVRQTGACDGCPAPPMPAVLPPAINNQLPPPRPVAEFGRPF